MKQFNWNEDKNRQLQQERGITFDDIIKLIQQGNLLDVIQHYNADKYPNQKIFIVQLDSYVYLVPFVETDLEIFLKTIIPSRKMTKKYLGDN
ncbi:BrnT family toxin [Crocosphaera sp. XPORK-15E]|uniref:BrnT family toxin n=1 Tax=Crocosphaera sp. XPORK-15E TaxID=3110247 RepID=UPI002B1EF154|nr:BrnT family toxin [Crocosphaera sp. XPORK-15E]MEA5534531.1 BrnT family toxin [Crocosphaera sp. XPORK-15E]